MGFWTASLVLALILPCSWLMLADGRFSTHGNNSETDVPAMFTFGDSWSDSGNNNFLSSLAKADFSPNGIDFTAAAPTGRFTNGRTLNDYIGHFLGLNSQPPYLSVKETKEMLTGVNFASGGAGILDESGAIFQERIPFSLQLDHFREVEHRLCDHLGFMKARRLISKSLYFVTIGSSDYLHNYLLPRSESARRYSPQEFQDKLIKSFSEQLKRLHSMGARKIAVAGIAPLGFLPVLRATASSSDGGFDFGGISEMAKSFNDAIQAMLGDLTNDLIGSYFTFTNTFDRFRRFVESPVAHGFVVGNVSCCGLGEMACSFGTPVCDDRASHVFWDKQHTTDRANMLLASYLTFGSDSTPFNLFDLASKK